MNEKNAIFSTTANSLVDGMDRRKVLLGGIAVAGALAMPAIVRAQSTPKIRIGFWPVASGLPFFAAVDQGYFKAAGLDVEVQKHASAQQAMEAMLSGRAEGSANGVATAVLAVGEIAQPGLMKIFCSNPSNAKYVLDEFIVAKDSPLQSVADLKGTRIACGPGIQNLTIARSILEKAGVADAKVTELPIAQHVAAIATDQVDAIYTLEPTGTVGRLNGVSRVLEAGVVAKYLLGDPMAPWFGGSATLTSTFIQEHPDVAKQFMEAYRRGVTLLKTDPAKARPSLKGYTAIDGALTDEVPMNDYVFYDEFTPEQIAYFQKYFDLFTEKGIFSKKLSVESMLYKA
ncbi:ABC transporter substrate-binding protein [Lampropedia puyangensis]|uniref:ABC transporter substrate-binding protein n=1 Tax=Lampropedia puyangensis TaxID=1330072 RepID=A0A4V4GR73_9BURK|nr:ABC transporter substrate-binding protein [Lampropedia puyangensis]